MDDALEAIREVVKTPASNGKKLDELVSYIQSKRGTPGLSITAVFFGIEEQAEIKKNKNNKKNESNITGAFYWEYV